MTSASDVQQRLTKQFGTRPGVATRKAFTRDALSVNCKIFVFFRPDGVVLKLPVQTGLPLIQTGTATQFEPGPGRFMREWFVLRSSTSHERVADLAEQAYAFVLSLQA